MNGAAKVVVEIVWVSYFEVFHGVPPLSWNESVLMLVTEAERRGEEERKKIVDEKVMTQHKPVLNYLAS